MARDAIYLANHPDDLEFADALRKCIGDDDKFVRILKAAGPNDEQPRDNIGRWAPKKWRHSGNALAVVREHLK